MWVLGFQRGLAQLCTTYPVLQGQLYNAHAWGPGCSQKFPFSLGFILSFFNAHYSQVLCGPSQH